MLIEIDCGEFMNLFDYDTHVKTSPDGNTDYYNNGSVSGIVTIIDGIVHAFIIK